MSTVRYPPPLIRVAIVSLSGMLKVVTLLVTPVR